MMIQQSMFVIPTYRLRDVPDTVRAYDENFRRNGHSVPILVFDDSSLINQLLTAPIEGFKTLGTSLSYWQEEIVRRWRFTKTNSITEGLHNKMEVLSRRAYGFREFENYRMRVLCLCG